MVPLGFDPEGFQFQFPAVIPTQASAPISSILFEFNVDSSPYAFGNCQDRKGIRFFAQIEQEMLLPFSQHQTIVIDAEMKQELWKYMKMLFWKYTPTPRGKGVYFSKKKMINIFYKIIPPYSLSSILLTSYTSHIPTHHPSYLNNFLQ